MSPTVDSYEFGSITVDGQEYTADLIILPDRVIAGWRRREGHALWPQDLADVLDARPELLIVGTGASGMMHVTDEARRAADEAGIELRASPTARAVDSYNRLRSHRRVAAALHLTC
jgi:hypothetical protein